MPRRARRNLLYDGCLAHVISRSIETKWIFDGDEELGMFKGLLIAVRDKYGFGVHHYCLMNTHFHMAVKIPDVEKFAAAMKWVKREYTKWYNGREKRRGTLWQERYKSLLIEDVAYLAACGRYIEYNPVEAGMVRVAREWAYSSSRYYELSGSDDLVDAYEFGGGALPAVEPEQFEKGDGIGSDLFKLQLREVLLPVP